MIKYAIDLLGELKKCSYTVDMLKAWIEGIDGGVYELDTK